MMEGNLICTKNYANSIVEVYYNKKNETVCEIRHLNMEREKEYTFKKDEYLKAKCGIEEAKKLLRNIH